MTSILCDHPDKVVSASYPIDSIFRNQSAVCMEAALLFAMNDALDNYLTVDASLFVYFNFQSLTIFTQAFTGKRGLGVRLAVDLAT